jgi:molecular chaperone HscA
MSFALGVDLGTSNTVAVVRWPDGRTRPLLFDGVPILPSAVYLDPEGRLHVGRDALRMAALDPARLEPNPKRRVDEATVLLGNREVPTVDLLAAVLGVVARAAVEATGFLPPAVLTYPATWGQARRSVLAGAAVKAGWPPPVLVPEPVAAARYFADVLRRPVPVGASIAVFDFGGGTLDVAVVRNTGTGFAVLGAGGIEDLGGLDVDAALVEHLGGLLAGTAPAAWAALANPNSTALLRDRGRFWDDVRGAKEMLSRAPVAPVPVPGQDQAVHLTREELDRIAGPLMQRAVYETAAVIQRCGLRPDQLAGLFLVGGSSRLPIVARLLHAQLGIAPTVLEQPELPVAEGALAELVPPVSSPAGPPVAVSAPPASPAPAPPPPAAPPKRRRWYRHPLTWIAAGAAVAVLGAATLLAVFLRGSYPEVAFTQNMSQVDRIPGAGKSVSAAFAAVQGDHAYVAYQQNRDLTVTAYDLASKHPQWTQVLTAPGTSSSASWESLTALPDGVLAVVNSYSGDQPRAVFALAWSDHRTWQHPMASDDRVLPTPSTVVVTDHARHRLVGLDRGAGTEKWALGDRTDRYGPVNSAAFPVLAASDLGTPTGLHGESPGVLGDGRLVQLASDSTARIIDAASGKEVQSKGNRGDQRSVALAIDGRLYIGSGSSGYELISYDLGSLDDPRTVYVPADKTHTLKAIAPCGKHICLLDVADKATRLVAVDPGGGSKEAWHADVPGADRLTPLGGGVMVQDTAGSDFYTAVFGPGGEQLLSPADGKGKTGVRVTAGSVLLFAGDGASYPQDQSMYGFGLGKHTVVPIGQATKVRSDTCAWNTKLLVCPSDTEFTVWRFAT